MFVLPLVKPTIELQIFDVQVWVEDNVIVQALSCFGRVFGEIRHGFVKASNGSRIGTAVRFCGLDRGTVGDRARTIAHACNPTD